MSEFEARPQGDYLVEGARQGIRNTHLVIRAPSRACMRIEVSGTVTTVYQSGRKFTVVKVRDISSSVSLTLTSSRASSLSDTRFQRREWGVALDLCCGSASRSRSGFWRFPVLVEGIFATWKK